MSGMPRCPRCEKSITKLDLQMLESGHYQAVAHCCPYCHGVLGAEIDPLAVRTEIVAQVEELLKKPR